jgi:hypothetical protein
VSAFFRQRINNLRNWHVQKALAKKAQVAEVFHFLSQLKERRFTPKNKQSIESK